jgi:hypothetical protein
VCKSDCLSQRSQKDKKSTLFLLLRAAGAAPGEWFLSSYIATGIENVPIFIKADNTENEIEKYLIENRSK